MQLMIHSLLLKDTRGKENDSLYKIFYIFMYFLHCPGVPAYRWRSVVHLSNKTILFFPGYHLKRVFVFGCIAGTAITLATILFNLIDKFKARKKTPSDAE